ncbi:hypothetical protein [Rhodopirellula sp. SWK7]|uniref:hypothetical protein n=1 Tax=Rhodopirellula sp. SWK7 TaxID=595460 RepID=UPI0002BE9D31|nr:hypothetical protein [Rhodopirellula sp. SWK7]EMI41331.1 hypothetical protein RRSWK_06131 [Rhodopirellula sp. SWK7]
MYQFAIGGIIVCSLFISTVGCEGNSEPEVMIDLQSAADLQAERDARDQAADAQSAKEMKSDPNAK